MIAPLLRAAAPARMLLLGNHSDPSPGILPDLLAAAREAGAVVALADLVPGVALPFDAEYLPLGPLQAIPLLAPADFVLIDTDANWFTVYNTLQLLMARAGETRTPRPLILLTGTEWPNARRDSYRQPGDIPERQPYAKRGIRPGETELVDDGAFGTRNNALREGGAHNGVLTALEDFRAAWPQPSALHRLPCFGGLALLVPSTRETDALRHAIDGCFTPDFLLRLLSHLEVERMRQFAALQATKNALTRSADALVRTRSLLARARLN